MPPKTVLGRQKTASGVALVGDLSVSHETRGYIRVALWRARPKTDDKVGEGRPPVAIYHGDVLTPPDEPTWLALTDEPLPVGAATDWAVLPSCGALVLFSGTARDHAPGRDGVERLEYEAYEQHVVPRFESIAGHMRTTWPDVGRIAILHRVGVVPVGESSVVVVVSSHHRPAAFEAARYGIDTLKATVPIWKRETWADGESWGLETQEIKGVGE